MTIWSIPRTRGISCLPFRNNAFGPGRFATRSLRVHQLHLLLDAFVDERHALIQVPRRRFVLVTHPALRLRVLRRGRHRLAVGRRGLWLVGGVGTGDKQEPGPESERAREEGGFANGHAAKVSGRMA